MHKKINPVDWYEGEEHWKIYIRVQQVQTTKPIVDGIDGRYQNGDGKQYRRFLFSPPIKWKNDGKVKELRGRKGFSLVKI